MLILLTTAFIFPTPQLHSHYPIWYYGEPHKKFPLSNSFIWFIYEYLEKVDQQIKVSSMDNWIQICEC